MKKHNILKVVSISLLAVVVLTWIFKTASFSSQLAIGKRSQMGITELFSYPSVVLQYFGQNLLFILAVGGLYGVLYKTGAYRKLLDKIVDGFKGRELLFLGIVATLFALITAFCGLTYAMVLVFPFIISIILLMGYDKLVAATTTVGGVVIGLMGSMYSTDINYYLNNYLSLKINQGVATKIIILVVGLALLIFNIVKYAKINKKVDAKLTESYIPDAVKEAPKSKSKIKVYPLVIVLDALFIVMCLASIAWSGVFKIKAFQTATTNVLGWKIAGFPLLGKIFGNVPAFGAWTLINMAILIVIASILVSIIYKVKLDDYLDGFIGGLKKAVGPAIIILVIYTILIANTYNSVQLTLYSAILKITSGFNVLTTSFVALIAGVFNIELLYSAYNVIPYLTTLVTDTHLYPLIGVIFQSMYALAVLAGPTSVILMITLYYLDIPYGQWLKHIWKLLLELVVVLFIIFLIIFLI